MRAATAVLTGVSLRQQRAERAASKSADCLQSRYYETGHVGASCAAKWEDCFEATPDPVFNCSLQPAAGVKNACSYRYRVDLKLTCDGENTHFFYFAQQKRRSQMGWQIGNGSFKQVSQLGAPKRCVGQFRVLSGEHSHIGCAGFVHGVVLFSNTRLSALVQTAVSITRKIWRSL